jgi:hypothetical protein
MRKNGAGAGDVLRILKPERNKKRLAADALKAIRAQDAGIYRDFAARRDTGGVLLSGRTLGRLSIRLRTDLLSYFVYFLGSLLLLFL